jgi:Ser/Thr protein kinase RdoA (MazF antagonist)
MTSDDFIINLDFGAFCETLAGLQIEAQISRTRNSEIFLCTVPTLEQRLAVKRVPGPERATLEFQSLSAAFKAMSGRYSVARPICLIAEHGLLVMEWVDGRSVYEHLVLRRIGIDEAIKAAAASGNWLSLFHASSQSDTAPIDFASKLRQVERLHASLSSYPLRQKYLAWMRERLQADSTPLRELRLRRARLHGDFKPHNILVRDGGALAIDFGHIYESTVWNDVAFFLAQLEWTVISSGRFQLLLRMKELRRAFLRAYESGHPPCPAAALSWLEREIVYRFAHQHLSRPRLRLRDLAALLVLSAMFVARRQNQSPVSYVP